MRPVIQVIMFALASAAAALQMWPDGFTRHHWGSSLVAKDWLFIDGGHLLTFAPGTTAPIFYILTSTIAIDLKQSWRNSSLPFVNIPKPIDYPFARAQSLWYDSFSDHVYARGGWNFSPADCYDPRGSYLCNNGSWTPSGHNFTVHTTNPPTPSMWQLDLDWVDTAKANDALPGKWSSSPASEQPPSYFINDLAATIDVRSPETLYSLGGSTLIDNILTAPAFQGLVERDLKTGQWSKKGSAEYGVAGYAGFGAGTFLPSFGPSGVLIFLGGYVPPNDTLYWGGTNMDTLQNMATIDIYDIATQQFHKQTATGDVPGARFGLCVVAAEDSNGNGVDLFMFGGFNNLQQEAEPRDDLRYVYVLSLPSFKWTKIKSSDTDERGWHNCEVIGQRQMVVIGGTDPTATFATPPDPWTSAIGVFDMSALKWSDGYDAQAAPYIQASSLAASNAASPFPDRWDSAAVQKIFQPSGGGSGTNTGAIAGGVVGGVLGLALCVAAGYYIWRRRRKQSTAPAETNESETMKLPPSEFGSEYVVEKDAQDSSPLELPSETLHHEAGPPHAWEIGTSNVATRHELEA